MSTASPVLADSQEVAPAAGLPRVFGRYRLFDYVGKGGMAEIFLARAETQLGAARLCVVKQIIPEFAGHPEFAEMLIHEAKLAAQLSHANIVQVFDLGREQKQLFIAMEYVEGLDLNALLRRCSQTKTPLPVGFALRIIVDTLKGLDYAHRARDEDGRPLGIVHRDVSPSNVLISLEGEVKLCDFGIAHANDLVEAQGPQLDEAIKGKAGYMSPEHARGEAIDARADVFAAGILLWELLSGRRLYKPDGVRATLLEQARRAEIPPIVDKGFPNYPELAAIVSRALSSDRNKRYPTAGAMERELEAYIVKSKLVASPLRLGEWLVDRFGTATIAQRRARERAVSDVVPAPVAISSHHAPSVPPDSVVRKAPERNDSDTMVAAPPVFPSVDDLPKPPPLPPMPPPEPQVPARWEAAPPPSSVALGTVDLGPPSNAVLEPTRSRAVYVIAALGPIVVAGIGALVWFLVHR